ncbi:MAG: SDR family NAD(P)-dependent oxidoreductase [Hydrogenophilaceae bacterium]|jgi:NAD(P)-dependent dehydrogenase (short-subunit alcohol dehydrogenase family)|nr:SDR family NAD(P)-dependent oxidoreductase [Hydrogenophilaceae bacterium]
MTEPRLALVTGASRGIGRAVALLLAQKGFRVIAVARAQRALEELDDAIRAAGGEATLVPLDLKDGDGLDRLGATIYERWGRLDALAACAGVLGPLTPAHQATPGVMSEVLAINLLANHRLIRAMHPLLRAAAAGRAVFLTSGVVPRPRAYWGPYAASKAGLEALVKCYAAEVAITPIRANLFNPGATRTAMRAKAYPGEDPMTLKTPADVAARIAPLLEASWTRTGEVINYESPP